MRSVVLWIYVEYFGVEFIVFISIIVACDNIFSRKHFGLKFSMKV